jgi:hypothetical protein
MNRPFVELHRRFETYKDNLTPDELAQQSYLSGFYGNQVGIGWDDLLSHRLVVILGEPGSGKSVELKSQHQRIKQTSFFLRLEQLVTEDINSILDDDEKIRLEKWKSNNTEATFFLDAVDESKLKQDDDFIKALERVKKAIGSSLHRSRFVISSRISEWRPQTDKNAVIENLGLNSAKQDKQLPTEINIVTIVALQKSQVECYAKVLGVVQVDNFLLAIEKSNAWAFAGRPLDVEHLIDYWKDKNHLANLTDLTEYMVNKLLAEVPNKLKQDPLTPEDARVGIESLAAAVLLCRTLKIRVSDYGLNKDESSITPSEALPETWLPADTLALTNRAIFDGATYGCLTFHHRYHTEYLAACWIKRLMANNCPLESLRDLLFATVDNQLVLRPNLAPVTAWLINEDNVPWRNRLRNMVLKTSPEIHLLYGDPAALPLDYRSKVLTALVKRYEGRDLVRLSWDRAALARFANNGLVDDINAYLIDTSISEDLRVDFLMVVREGKLVTCVPTVLKLFADNDVSENLKSYAVTVVRDIGDIQHRQQLASLCSAQTDLSNRLIGLLCEALFPRAIDVEGLLALLVRSKEMKREVLDLPYILKPLLKQELNSNTAAELLRGLLKLLKDAPLLDTPPISKRYLWVTSLILTSLNSLFSSSSLVKTHYDVAIDAIGMLKIADKYNLVELLHSDKADGLDLLEAAIKRHHDFRCHLFWTRVNNFRQQHHKEPDFHNISGYATFIPLSHEDLEWLLSSAKNSTNTQDCLLSFKMSIEVMWSNREPYFLSLLRLLKCASTNREMLKQYMQYAWLCLSAPVRRFWYRYIKGKLLEKWWWENRLSVIKKNYRRIRDFWWLYRHLSELKMGKYPTTLVHFAHDVGGDSQSQYSGSDWSKLVPKWGKRITEAVKLGCMNAWLEYSPDFPHEKSNRNSVNNYVIIGLAGLQAKWRAGLLDFNKLNSGEVEKAVRYACNELNGFPEWFSTLLEAKPDECSTVLSKAISGEWAYTEKLEHVYDVVAKLASTLNPSPAIWQVLIKQLQASDPLHPKILEYTLAAIFQSNNYSADKLHKLASERIQQYQPEQTQWLIWMKTWLQMDALSALSYLENELLKFSTVEQDLIVIRLCSSLSGRWGEQPKLKHISYLEISALSKLIPLVYHHVRPKEDVERAGNGVYSPEARDHAQDFRSFLLESLNSRPDVEIDQVLVTFLTKPEMKLQHDWILHLLDGRKSKRAEDAIWCPKDIRIFSEKFISEPHSDDQLFRLIQRLIQNIKDEVEASENASNRLQIRIGDKEGDFRGFLLKKLSDQSQGWFFITQETEVDLGQRPDLRVERDGLNTLPIEIKLADKGWTLPDLLNGLENQLVGQYLRPTNIRYGIYVLGNATPKRNWEVPDSTEKLNFDELVKRIQGRAKVIQDELREGVDGIEVIGIDFSDPRKR